MEQREDRGTGNDHLYRRKGNPKGRPHSIKTILRLMKPGGPSWCARRSLEPQHVIMLHGPQLALGGSSNVLVTAIMLWPPEMLLPLLTWLWDCCAFWRIPESRLCAFWSKYSAFHPHTSTLQLSAISQKLTEAGGRVIVNYWSQI